MFFFTDNLVKRATKQSKNKSLPFFKDFSCDIFSLFQVEFVVNAEHAYAIITDINVHLFKRFIIAQSAMKKFYSIALNTAYNV